MKPDADNTIAISAVGACTCMGNSISSAAAFRAGVTRTKILEDISSDDDEAEKSPTYSGYPISFLTESFEGLGRYVRMGSAALHELIDSAHLNQNQVNNTAFICTLPCFVEEMTDDESLLDDIKALEKHYSEIFFTRTGYHNGIKIPEKNQYYYFGGATGFFKGVNKAIDMLQNQHYQYCVVGSVDSLIDPPKLMQLCETGRLKGPENAAGIMPGEACAFILLTLSGTPDKLPVQLCPASFARESNNYYSGIPSTGSALQKVLTEALSKLNGSSSPEGDLYHDLNGETYRSHEWGLTEVMTSKSLQQRRWLRHLPAESFGDTGVAYGALATVLAYRAFIRGYAAGNNATVLCSDTMSERASLYLYQALN
ncbi:MAG: hypothetical protein OEZ39_05505 [Gammaproteobacteria bacterium]|nr:hypothetical protein [Gammaproteobacteria bacterium]MDH5651311.1 hypothetical protein [Gammaproteobacteria bacterium]